jgi:hypothetical protein
MASKSATLPELMSDAELFALSEELAALRGPGDPPSCWECRHFAAYPGMRCAAFPAGIPNPNLSGDADHRLPYDGDHGLRFEARQPRDPRADRAEIERALRDQVELRRRLGVTSVS